jgi:hypothetical protein
LGKTRIIPEFRLGYLPFEFNQFRFFGDEVKDAPETVKLLPERD